MQRSCCVNATVIGMDRVGYRSNAMGDLQIGPASADDFDAIRVFLAEQGWAHRVADARRFRRMMERTDRTIVARSDGHIVGFGRGLCDGVSNGYISMLAVAEAFRKRGIGRALVEGLVGDDRGITWVLRAGRDSAAFWRRMGFAPSEIAMERIRDEG
jgi:GNAT superfamily N-acetyltransferase